MKLAKSWKKACAVALTFLACSINATPSVKAADSGTVGIRSGILDFVDDPWSKPQGHGDEAARFFPDGLLVINNGIVKDCGPYDATIGKYPGLTVTNLPNRIVMPGFVDGHIHFPQTRVLGAYGEQLLPWLQEWIFPEEMKYRDAEYAKEGLTHFFDNLLANGTTTVQDYGTSFESAIGQYFDEAGKRNMRVICGLSGLDRNAPDGMLLTPQAFYDGSKRLIEKYHNKGRNLYCIVPRFAYGDSDDMLNACGRLHKEYPDCWINTHVSENPTETRNAAAEHHCKDYLGCYEKYGLVCPKFTAGHGVWLSDDEFRRIHKAGASVSFCPNSNTFLGSGYFRLGQATNPNDRIRLTFGTDMGGGNSFSMINVLNQAYKIGMCNNTMLDGSIDPRWKDDQQAERNKLNAMRAFYSATLGGAKGLYLDDKIGNFQPGKEADFVVIDWNGGPMATKWHQSLIVKDGSAPQNIDQAAKLLFGVMAVGDDRAIDETWVYGKRMYKRSAEALASGEVKHENN
ncbi:MAG TPA: guanine deaminase [Chroococcales cyanobacterium]